MLPRIVKSRKGMKEPTHQVDSKRVHGGKSQQAQGIQRSKGKKILEHIFSNYGEILPQDLVANILKLGKE